MKKSKFSDELAAELLVHTVDGAYVSPTETIAITVVSIVTAVGVFALWALVKVTT